MLDYENDGYTVEYKKIGCGPTYSQGFDTETEAVEFIKNNRHQWAYYELTQIRTAIIDF